ncbi:MAG: tRNA uridine-5-carboxymethylaminomethyl(34) synthesis GTPase MnmE [Clostridiales bacterium]|jgi:tRNA modification GTPase|nr:tRNA uridine-5-carboxymethylaminomethyl(34) synthesis GTPase MnmE [Clostridiales bacterium]
MKRIIQLDDTIAGIGTPSGGPISVIRISGENALNILGQIFLCASKDFESHRIYYGWIADGGARLDEVLVSVMLAPRTFTRQDVVEINCHGGALVTQKILNLVLRQGARPAEPGEFTKRAYLSGRIDLSRAEAVMDMISARSELSHGAALAQLEGRLSRLLDNCSDSLLNLLARIEMAIDYPEHEEAELLNHEVLTGIEGVLAQIEGLLKTADTGRIIREGIKTVILGRPNVGKSSLLNALLGQERAIVTHIPGTTRDILRESIKIGGLFLNVSDTAGIRETDDIIESQGVARSLKEGEAADLLLLVLDGSREADFPPLPRHKNVIVVVNKSDLPQKLDLAQLEIDAPIVHISAKNHEGIEELIEKIQEIFIAGNLEIAQEIVTNSRHINLLEQGREHLNSAVHALSDAMPIDLIAIDINSALHALGEITGATIDEALIEKIFAEFCLGK